MENEIGGACSTYGIHEKYIQYIGWKNWKRPLGKRRRRWKDIKMDLREIQWESMDCMHLAQYRDQGRALVNTATNLQVP